MTYESALGLHINAVHGPLQCPWGGPESGDDHDKLYLIRGDEDRIFSNCTWYRADYQNWAWLLSEAHDGQEILEKVKASAARSSSRAILSPRKPRKLVLKTRREVDSQ